MKLIKISPENHTRLTRVKAALMASDGINKSYDEAVDFLLDQWEKTVAKGKA